MHSTRGVDAVPCVYAVDGDGHLAVPVDQIKPKRPGPLQRERNLARDPRATLLIDHWDPVDWTRLWWVRANLLAVPADPARSAALGDRLRQRYPPYRAAVWDRLLVFEIVAVSGWAGSA
ncbi:hypothetical protein [Conexibacter sp. DBS9H8]|uniref:hypothetical protein n=1 Tax=Conexibacter sp. DBS9H8 TaxID=2937801 RepID=UPI003530AA41